MKRQSKNPLYSGFPYKKSLEEESDDGYISPQDISIKDEKIWDPSDEEILSYALKLGYDIEKDPDELFEVAYYYMKYPLPEGWKRGIMKSTKELVYINLLDGEIETTTEIEEMAHQMYLEKKSEMNQKGMSIFNKPPEKKEVTTVVPRKKIPPINPLQKSNNSNGLKNSLPSIKEATTKPLIKSNEKAKDDIFKNKKNEIEDKNKINDDIINENIIKLNNNIDKFLEKSLNLNDNDFKDLDKSGNKNIESKINNNNKINNNEKEKEKKLKENKKSNYELLLNLGGGGDEDEEEEEDELEEEEDNINTKDNNKEDSFLQQMLKKEKEIEQLRKQKEKDIENVLNKNEGLKNFIDIKKIKYETDKEENESSPVVTELQKEKNEYLKNKLEELQKYKDEIKNKFQDKKDKYEKEKKEKQKDYDNKLKEELSKNKKKFEKQFKDKLDLYEKQLINKKSKEEKKYIEELKTNIKLKKEEDKEALKKREEKKKDELKQKKLQLKKDIEILKKQKIINETNLSQKKMNLQKNILLFEEKKNIEKKNKNKKYELEIKSIENKLENEFQQNKKNLSQNISSTKFSSILISKNNNFNENLVNNFEEVLDKEYDINCETFEQELASKKLKEIDKYINMITNDKNEQIDFYKTEISSVEKDYYKSIANIRNNFQKNKINNENNLKLKFEQTLNGYEDTKKMILEQNKQLMKYINDNLHKLLIGNYSLKQTETNLEEFLLNLKDKYLIIYQKNKNNFEMYENDYIFKTQFIKYLLDIINYMTKLFNTTKLKNKKDNNNFDEKININNNQFENDSQNLAETLLIFCNDKINEYKKKYKKVKNSSIFHFMNGNLMKSQSFDSSRINISDFDDINKTILFDLSKRNQIKNKEYYNNNIDKNIGNKIISHNESININNELNSDNNKKNLDNNELTYYVIEQESNFVVPTIPENILSNLNEDILLLYSNITLFLKNEYNNILQIKQIEKINNQNKNNNKKNININLNLTILDKIKSNAEEAFNYLLLNYQKNGQFLNIKKKLRLVTNNIEEYKNNFNLEKYLSKNKSNNILDEELDIVNDLKVGNQFLSKGSLYLNNYINNKQDISNNSKSINSKTTKNTIDVINENEEQKQSIEELNLKKNKTQINNNSNSNYLNGRFNNFYRQYSSKSLVDSITNPYLYQFFNYKKNKYELDKSLGKISMP